MLTRLAARRGVTLPELVISLAVAAVVFAAFAVALAHQERVHAALGHRIRVRAQLREGLSALVADLRAASPRADDIVAGEARDSSLELRTTIGTAVVCEVADGTIVAALASFVTPVGIGDTAWVYTATDSAAGWSALPLADGGTLPPERPSTCPFPARASSALGEAALRSWHVLHPVDLPASLPVGTPVRVTRPVRYSLYRSGDTRWYLGRREWSAVRGRFETIQPVSGPYRPYAPPYEESSGLELRYADSAGVPVPSGSASADHVAQVAVIVRATAGDRRTSERQDVMSVTVGFRDAMP